MIFFSPLTFSDPFGGPPFLPEREITAVSTTSLLFCAYSLIVDDVDSHSILSDGSDLDGSLSRESSSQNSASQTPLDSPGGPRERIKQIQVEAETRRGEFARLLEEHAQVVRKLKMMEAEEQLSTTTTGNVIGGAHA